MTNIEERNRDDITNAIPYIAIPADQPEKLNEVMDGLKELSKYPPKTIERVGDLEVRFAHFSLVRPEWKSLEIVCWKTEKKIRPFCYAIVQWGDDRTPEMIGRRGDNCDQDILYKLIRIGNDVAARVF